jgi:hypothetical protein
MKIKLNSVFVKTKTKRSSSIPTFWAFKKIEIPVGESKWLTVVSPEEPDGTQLLLEPNNNPAAKQFQQAIFQQGIPATAFQVEDLQLEFERMQKLGVKFPQPPIAAGPVIQAVFDDTCGNLIQLYQV